MSHYFKIDSLSEDNSTIVPDVTPITGDDRGGFAVSAGGVFLTGDTATGRFDASFKVSGTNLGATYDGMLSNIANGSVYALSADGTNPLEVLPSSFTITTLLGFDESTGMLGPETITLSSAITINSMFQVFAGFNRAVIAKDNGHFFDVDLISGDVTDLGQHAYPSASLGEIWVSYGVAEYFGGELYVDYAATDSNNDPIIERMKISDGTTETIVALSPDFAELHEFSVLPGTDRWYFHREMASGAENLGFADATFLTAATIVSDGGDGEAFLSVVENSTAVTAVAAVGSANLDFEIVNDPAAPDGAKFTIDNYGNLFFVQAPDAELPGDADGNNVYDVLVRVSVKGELDSGDTQLIHVAVKDVVDTLAGPGELALAVAENSKAVVYTAMPVEDVAAFTYRINGGADAARFVIDANSGAVGFAQSPDFETPADANHDNVYDVVVELMEGSVTRDAQTLHITVGDTAGHAVIGNGQANRIDAAHGIAGLFATNEEDLIKGAGGNDKLWGLGSNDRILGGTGVDTLVGGNGNDLLDGGVGRDRLFGGAGHDWFRFGSKLGGANADRIADFTRGTDRIVLDDAIFGDLAAGAPLGNTFHKGHAATTAHQHVIYDAGSGKLFYDADGAGGTDQVLMAVLTQKPALSAADFLVV